MTPRVAEGDRRAHARARVLATFLDGAAQIAGYERFIRHLRPDADVDWGGVLAEPGWSDGQRVLIQLAAALCGGGQVSPGAFSAHLTGPQTGLVSAMCQAARG